MRGVVLLLPVALLAGCIGDRGDVTPKTWILEKGAGETLVVELARQDGRVVAAAVR